MRFPERDLKPFAEPVSSEELVEGSIYFSVTFIDDDMLTPTMEPFIFVGRDLRTDESGQVYFQDVESYLRGVRYDTFADEDHATFLAGSENELGHIFEYERALDVLMACSLRRKKLRG